MTTLPPAPPTLRATEWGCGFFPSWDSWACSSLSCCASARLSPTATAWKPSPPNRLQHKNWSLNTGINWELIRGQTERTPILFSPFGNAESKTVPRRLPAGTTPLIFFCYGSISARGRGGCSPSCYAAGQCPTGHSLQRCRPLHLSGVAAGVLATVRSLAVGLLPDVESRAPDRNSAGPWGALA